MDVVASGQAGAFGRVFASSLVGFVVVALCRSISPPVPLLCDYNLLSSSPYHLLQVLSIVAIVVVAGLGIQLFSEHPPLLPRETLRGSAPFSEGSSGTGQGCQLGNVLVTGGAGYIGSHMVLELLENGCFVVIVDNLSRSTVASVTLLQDYAEKVHAAGRDAVKLATVDVRDYKAMLETVNSPQNDISTVMHFAGYAFSQESVENPYRYIDNIVSGTSVLVDVISASPQVKNLVFSSSCATYGNLPQEAMPITETTVQKPMSPYGLSKLRAEQIILQRLTGDARVGSTKVAILRYFNVIGSDARGRIGPVDRPFLRKYSRIVDVALDAAMGIVPEVKMFGEGKTVRDYIHVSDLVEAHMVVGNALTQESRRGSTDALIYNVGVGKGYSVADIVEAAERVVGREIPKTVVKAMRPGDPMLVLGSPRRIERELGWKAKHTEIKDMIQTAWDWRNRKGGNWGKKEDLEGKEEKSACAPL